MERGIPRQQVERAARLYKRVSDASQALGITVRSFNRLCHRYGIETPWGRARRLRSPAPPAGAGGGRPGS